MLKYEISFDVDNLKLLIIIIIIIIMGYLMFTHVHRVHRHVTLLISCKSWTRSLVSVSCRQVNWLWPTDWLIILGRYVSLLLYLRTLSRTISKGNDEFIIATKSMGQWRYLIIDYLICSYNIKCVGKFLFILINWSWKNLTND